MTEIRSFRRVFDLERRIYSVDRLRLNPAGVPIRGALYFLAILAIGLVIAALPLAGAPAKAMPWYLRDIALPALGATVLGAIRIEGRTFHLAALALARPCTARRLTALQRCSAVDARWCPPDVVLLPDGSDAGMRRLRYTGPGAVVISVGYERRGRAREHGARGLARPGRRPVVALRQCANAPCQGRGEVLVLGAGARITVAPGGEG